MGKLETTSVSIGALAERVRDRGLELPEIQRSFVWNRPQVRDLLDSLYRGFPIGTLLFWRAGDLEYSRDIESDAAQGSNQRNPDFVLDGQQRLTALSKVIHDGDPDIRFHIETEQFEVANAASKRDPHWIPVHNVFAKGAIAVAKERGLFADEAAEEMLDRLNRLEQIKNTTVRSTSWTASTTTRSPRSSSGSTPRARDCAKRSWLSPGSPFGFRAW